MKSEEFLHKELTKKIIGAAIEVHKTLGPGFLETTYEAAFAHELKLKELSFEKQKRIDIPYKGIMAGKQRLDFLIKDKVIVELKVTNEINELHQAQLLAYLKATDKRVGLLINFAKVKTEIKRIVL